MLATLQLLKAKEVAPFPYALSHGVIPVDISSSLFQVAYSKVTDHLSDIERQSLAYRREVNPNATIITHYLRYIII